MVKTIDHANGQPNRPLEGDHSGHDLVCISHLKLRFMPMQTTQTYFLKLLLFAADT